MSKQLSLVLLIGVLLVIIAAVVALIILIAKPAKSSKQSKKEKIIQEKKLMEKQIRFHLKKLIWLITSQLEEKCKGHMLC